MKANIRTRPNWKLAFFSFFSPSQNYQCGVKCSQRIHERRQHVHRERGLTLGIRDRGRADNTNIPLSVHHRQASSCPARVAAIWSVIWVSGPAAPTPLPARSEVTCAVPFLGYRSRTPLTIPPEPLWLTRSDYDAMDCEPERYLPAPIVFFFLI